MSAEGEPSFRFLFKQQSQGAPSSFLGLPKDAGMTGVLKWGLYEPPVTSLP